MKKKLITIFFVLILTVVTSIICMEVCPAYIHSSTVFSTAGQTEIQLDVLMNTIKEIDKDSLVKKIITEHQSVNGVRENTVYILKLYRTKFHYRKGIEFDTIIYKEEGQ